MQFRYLATKYIAILGLTNSFVWGYYTNNEEIQDFSWNNFMAQQNAVPLCSVDIKIWPSW